MITIGIDPDTKKHGVAWARDGKLLELVSLATDQLVSRLVADAAKEQLVIKLEDINAFKPVIQRPGWSKAKMMHIAQNIGAVKYAATLLLQELTMAGLKVNMVYPMPRARSGKRFNKDSFNRFTGWNGASNPDSRDAAMIALYGKPQARQLLIVCGG